MKIWQILIFSFLLNSCDKKYICQNEAIITSPSAGDVTVEFNYNQSQEDLMSDVEKFFHEDLCWKEKEIGLDLNGELMKTTFLKTCPDGTIRHIPISEVIILMNQQGETMLNSKIISIDSIEKWIGNNFPNELDYEREEIFFLWDKESPKSKIEKAFEKIKNGYLKSYNRTSKDSFGKELCELDVNELNEIRESLKFKVKLRFGKIILPPPPPPSQEQIKVVSE